jgi:hypothetical protein
VTDAFPLQWPHGQPRTKVRTQSAYRVTPQAAYGEMIDELSRFGAQNVAVSSNMPLRRDGTPYRDALDEPLTDPGVAVWFNKGSRRIALAVDQFSLPWENCRAIFIAVEAFRAIERSGAKQVLDQAFTGFAALPPPSGQRAWRDVLGLYGSPSTTEVSARYKLLAREHAGDEARMKEINIARDAAMKEVTP